VVARLVYGKPSGSLAMISSSPRYVSAALLAQTQLLHRQADVTTVRWECQAFVRSHWMRVCPYSARAPGRMAELFTPVLADARQAVTFCGPRPRDRILPSVSASVDDCGNVDKRRGRFSAAHPGYASSEARDSRGHHHLDTIPAGPKLMPPERSASRNQPRRGVSGRRSR